MRILRCLIVDDEPLAHRVIEKFAQDLSFIQIVRKCKNALEALEALHEESEIDVIFLDIEMPRLSGLSFARSLKNPPLIVFTTAYDDHAVEGFELEAVDYLKKPFSFERFCRTIERVERRLEGDRAAIARTATPWGSDEKEVMDASPAEELVSGSLFVKHDGVTKRVPMEQVTLIEAMGDYVKLWLGNDSVLSHRTLRDWESKLPVGNFLRVHKSYIVAVDHIDVIKHGKLVVGGRAIPIGRGYREALAERTDGL